MVHTIKGTVEILIYHYGNCNGYCITIYFDNPLPTFGRCTNTQQFIREEGEIYKILTSIMDNDPLLINSPSGLEV